MIKTCRRCGAHKTLDQFYLEASGTPRRSCKPCNVEENKERRERRKSLARDAAYLGFVPEAQEFYLKEPL